MQHNEQTNIALIANTETVVKEFNENLQSFVISNNSAVDVEIHLVDQDTISVEEGHGIILNNATIIYAREDLPKNKIIAISRSGSAKLTILRGE